MRGEATFPITERRVLERGAVFNDTDTYYNYTLRLQKVFSPIVTSPAWFTPAVRHVAKGLKNCQDKSFNCPNFIRSRLLIRQIKSETTQSDFAHA